MIYSSIYDSVRNEVHYFFKLFLSWLESDEDEILSGNQYTEEEIRNLLQSLFYEKKRVRALQSKMHEIGDERNSLKEELDKWKEKSSKLALPRDHKLLEEKIENLKVASEMRDRKWEEESSSTQDIKERYASVSEDLKALEAKLKSREEQILSLEGKLEVKSAQYKRAEKNTTSLVEQLEELKKDTKQVSLRKIVVDELEKKLSKSSDEKNRLYNELNEAKELFEKDQKALRVSFQEENKNLVEKLQAKEKLLEDLSYKLVIASAHRFAMKRQSMLFKNTLQGMNNRQIEFESKSVQNTKSAEELRSKLKSVYEDCQKKDNEINRLSHFFNQVKEAFHGLERRKKSLEQKKIQLSKRLSQALGCLDSAKSSFYEIEGVISKNHSGNELIERLKEVLSQAKLDIDISDPLYNEAPSNYSVPNDISKEKKLSDDRKEALKRAGALLEQTTNKLKDRESLLKRVLYEFSNLQKKSQVDQGAHKKHEREISNLKESYEMQIEDALKELESLRESTESLQYSLTAAQSEKDFISKENRELKEKERDLEAKVKNLYAESLSIQEKYLASNKQSEIEEVLQERVDQLEKENQNNLDRIHQMQEKVENHGLLQGELEKLKGTIADLEACTNSEIESSKHREENEELRDQIDILRDEKGNLDQKVFSLQRELDQDRKKNETLKLDLESSLEKCQNLKDRVILTRQTLDKRDQEINQSRKDLLKWQEESSKQEINLKHLKLEELEKQVSLVKQVLIKGVRKAKDLESRFVEITEEKIDLQNKLADAEREVASLRSREEEHEKVILSYDTRYLELKQNLTEENVKKEALLKDLKKIKEDSSAKEYKIQQLEKRHQHHESELIASLDREKQQRQTLEKKQTEVLDHLKTSKDRIYDLEKVLEEKQGIELELLAKKKSQKELEEKLEQVEISLVDSETGRKFLAASLNSEKRILADRNSTYDALKISYTKLCQKFEEQEEIIKSQKNGLESVQVESIAYAKKVAQLHGENENLTEQLDRSQTLNDRNMEELSSSKEELRALYLDKEKLSLSLETLNSKLLVREDSFNLLDQRCKELEKANGFEQRQSKDLFTRVDILEEAEGRLLEEVSVQKQELIQKDVKLKKALQHLAKKLKETTVLHDWAEKQKARNMELAKDLDEQRSKVRTLHLESDKEKESAKEKLLDAEHKVNLLIESEKRLHVDLKQKIEVLSELEGVKDKYNTLKQTFDQLRGLMGGKEREPEPPPSNKKVPAWGDVERKEQNSTRSSGLFSSQSEVSKPAKESLF